MDHKAGGELRSPAARRTAFAVRLVTTPGEDAEETCSFNKEISFLRETSLEIIFCVISSRWATLAAESACDFSNADRRDSRDSPPFSRR